MHKFSKGYIGISSKQVKNIESVIDNFNKQRKNNWFYYIKRKDETIWLTTTKTWAKLINVTYYFFAPLTKKQKRQTIINTINDNLFDINNIIIQNKSLIEWSKYFRQYKYYLINYCYLHGLQKTKHYIQNYINSQQHVNKQIVQLCHTGKLITINNVTNNIAGWMKIVNLSYRNINIYKIRKHVLTPLKKDYIEISGIYATYEQWSLFINQHKTFIEDMIHKMSYNYAKQYLYNLVVNNTSFITNHIEITVNNETHSLYYWEKRINRSMGTLYRKYKYNGMDFVINYISHILNKELDAKNKFKQQTLVFMDEF